MASIKVNLSEQASEELESMAKSLNMSKTEVLRQGLAIMQAYAHSKKNDNNAAILLEENRQQKQLILPSR